MKRWTLFSFPLLLAACLGDEPNDGGSNVTHAPGTWRFEWSCTVSGSTETGCSIGEIYKRSPTAPDEELAVVWDSLSAEGEVSGNQLSVGFLHGPEGAPNTFTEDALFTFDRDEQDVFQMSSTYQDAAQSGGCMGTATRVPDSTQSC